VQSKGRGFNHLLQSQHNPLRCYHKQNQKLKECQTKKTKTEPKIKKECQTKKSVKQKKEIEQKKNRTRVLPPPLSIARVRGVWCLRGAVSTSGETVRELALVRGAVVAGACCVLEFVWCSRCSSRVRVLHAAHPILGKFSKRKFLPP